MIILSIVGSILVADAAIFLVTLLVCRPFWRTRVIEDAQRMLARDRSELPAGYRRMVCPICWIQEVTDRTHCPEHDMRLIPLDEIERLHLPLPTTLTARDRPRELYTDAAATARQEELRRMQTGRIQ